MDKECVLAVVVEDAVSVVGHELDKAICLSVVFVEVAVV